MATILALDTSSDACSVALAYGDSIAESMSLAPREHTQRLLPMVAALLQQQQLSLSALDAIAFGRGPGSFTGLRICLSVAQGLAYGADLPLVGVSSLQALANQALRESIASPDTLIVPVIDARMDEVYWSAYRVSADNTLDLIAAEQVTGPQQCAEAIAKINGPTILGLGSGWHYPILTALPEANIIQDYYPAAYDVAQLALPAYERGDTLTPEQAQPQYLRNEIHWKKRQRIRAQS